MPYIKQEDRRRFTNAEHDQATNSGQLNFVLTRVLKAYVGNKGNTYSTYNDIMGALEGAKLEIYRRLIATYEDGKIELNGDVYDE